MKLLLIGYYHLAEGFLGAMDALRNIFKYEIEFFPFSEYADIYNINIVIESLQKHITRNPINMTPNTLYIKGKQPDIILWWNFNISYDNFIGIKNTSRAINIFYSWDDPFQTENVSDKKIFAEFDVIYTCCRKSIEFYKSCGCTNVYYAKPGFDKLVHCPLIDQFTSNEYDCDISIVCTNLYDTNIHLGKTLNRRTLIDSIISDKTITLKIYGPQYIKDIYPDNYAGFIKFTESHKIFSRSRINICTHVRKNGFMYINERVCQILGSGGLLYIDDVPGLDNILNKKTECVVIDETNMLQQIHNILNNYSRYEIVKKYGHLCALQTMTWDVWAEIIHGGCLEFLSKGKNLDITENNYLILLDDKIIKCVYTLCLLLTKSHIRNDNYLILLNNICNEHNININDFININMKHILITAKIFY